MSEDDQIGRKYKRRAPPPPVPDEPVPPAPPQPDPQPQSTSQAGSHLWIGIHTGTSFHASAGSFSSRAATTGATTTGSPTRRSTPC